MENLEKYSFEYFTPTDIVNASKNIISQLKIKREDYSFKIFPIHAGVKEDKIREVLSNYNDRREMIFLFNKMLGMEINNYLAIFKDNSDNLISINLASRYLNAKIGMLHLTVGRLNKLEKSDNSFFNLLKKRNNNLSLFKYPYFKYTINTNNGLLQENFVKSKIIGFEKSQVLQNSKSLSREESLEIYSYLKKF